MNGRIRQFSIHIALRMATIEASVFFSFQLSRNILTLSQSLSIRILTQVRLQGCGTAGTITYRGAQRGRGISCTSCSGR